MEYPDIKKIADDCLKEKWFTDNNDNDTDDDCSFCEAAQHSCELCHQIYPQVTNICRFIGNTIDKTDVILVSEFKNEYPDAYELITRALKEIAKTGEISEKTLSDLKA
jgi:hypothetical protein